MRRHTKHPHDKICTNAQLVAGQLMVPHATQSPNTGMSDTSLAAVHSRGKGFRNKARAFWMMACALPGSPWISSCTIFTARSTASGLPLILICRGSPSGKSCAGTGQVL